MRLPILLASIAIGLAAPSSAEEQPYRVFFDWGKPELTRDAQTILGDVVKAYQSRQPKLIFIAGFTDRSGPPAVNLAASRKRAEAVKAWLAEHGIPASAMTVSAYGESRPIVPTEDGVREVQNRRVEIAFETPAG
jgi:outer membrane protein OmpA-like peptidoglycan-associated protein